MTVRGMQPSADCAGPHRTGGPATASPLGSARVRCRLPSAPARRNLRFQSAAGWSGKYGQVCELHVWQGTREKRRRQLRNKANSEARRSPSSLAASMEEHGHLHAFQLPQQAGMHWMHTRPIGPSTV